MILQELVDGTSRVHAHGDLHSEITALTVDSRAVQPGTLFAAIRGEKVDGHDFIETAQQAGASAILAETTKPDFCPLPWLQVPNTKQAIAEAADTFYGKPSDLLRVAGVTGTNGKTTTAFILQHLIAASTGRCGLLGTVHYDTGLGPQPSSHTTPDWITLQQLLTQMQDNGCRGVAMEVSSHALQQHRVQGMRFDSAIFTNLTQDHLDYHHTMEEYFMAKAAFYEHLTMQGGEKKPVAVINGDDTYGRRLVKMYEGKLSIVKFGMSIGCEFRANDIRTTAQGTQFSLEARGRSFLVRLPLIGRFNVYNALGAVASMWSMGYNLRETLTNLALVPQVPGRMECVPDQKPFRVFVDYAHTPDALENALKTLRDLQPKRLITVFGCGGDRDRTKRPLMGAASESLSTYSIVTSDNPRSEDPQGILNEIKAGMRGSNHELILDRKAAIGRAILNAREGDIILIAGKGHEQGQIFATETQPFDDVAVARGYLREWRAPEKPERR